VTGRQIGNKFRMQVKSASIIVPIGLFVAKQRAMGADAPTVPRPQSTEPDGLPVPRCTTRPDSTLRRYRFSPRMRQMRVFRR